MTDPNVLYDDLRAQQPLDMVVSRWILEATPVLFGTDHELYWRWKHRLGKTFQLDPKCLVLVGSAALGFSMNPNKLGKPFDDESDVDVAAISSAHFDSAWRWMRSLGAQRYKLPPIAQAAIDDHRTRLIYFGAIASDRILPHLPFGAHWKDGLLAMQPQEPVNGRTINVRIYRDFESLRTYQHIAFRTLRAKLLAG